MALHDRAPGYLSGLNHEYSHYNLSFGHCVLKFFHFQKCAFAHALLSALPPLLIPIDPLGLT